MLNLNFWHDYQIAKIKMRKEWNKFMHASNSLKHNDSHSPKSLPNKQESLCHLHFISKVFPSFYFDSAHYEMNFKLSSEDYELKKGKASI